MQTRLTPYFRFSLGNTLVQQGLITEEQLGQALKQQRQSGERTEQILVSLGFVTSEQVTSVLNSTLGTPYISLADFIPQEEALASVPGTLARRHNVLPIRVDRNNLLVAMSNPLNVLAIDEVRLASGYDVRVVVATEEEIAPEIRHYYGAWEETSHKAQRLAPENTAESRFQSAKADNPPYPGLVIELVDSLFAQAIAARASDIHIEPLENEVQVRFRIDGVLQRVNSLRSSLLEPIISRVKVLANMDIAEHRVPQDGHLELKLSGHDVDVRISTLPTINGEKMVLRLLDKSTRIDRIEKLGFSISTIELFRRLISRPYGMILVTGPTGCGKTTTLYAALGYLNTPQQNIITVEDPIEYQIPGVNQVQVNPKAGITFASGLRAILRQDPNIIMVGEIRDRETADIAIRSALTGHLVFSTLHTNDAAGAITRLLDMNIEPYLLASALSGVVAQRLVRTICPHCAEEYLPDPDEWEALNLKSEMPCQPLRRGRGCPDCRYTGYLGRTAISESMEVTPELHKLILTKRPAEEIRQLAVKQGMTTLFVDAVNKLLAGQTTVAEILRATAS
ncbi:MAG: GspE/PulE family protein [bacterium]|jgi:type IV pilus assembly protein PilB